MVVSLLSYGALSEGAEMCGVEDAEIARKAH